ncbi:Amidohydrolase 3 [Penicillium chermesinum]|uniref:Amidohydrolase 3 n=1 Tax=Penicillium chermesinum TaxID=63820 RepID=A0A9W9NNU4_9EURO|nr:Amidohydrolase 3 [Penicillium chermesinum]KAJ5223256.1 Amidohydrolase 3 [Penicillium chermesinum]
MSTSTVFTNGRIFCSNTPQDVFASAMVIAGQQITYLADDDERVTQAKASGSCIDLEQKLVLPGFIDGHVHILQFGLSLQKLDLLKCRSLDEIRHEITIYAKEFPQEPRILCRGWIQSVTEGQARATMLERSRSQANLHRSLGSTFYLLGVNSIGEPPGGRIHRDALGRPSGLLEEAAQFNIVWPFLDKVASMEKKLAALETAFQAHTQAGYTGLVDMAMDENNWEALNMYRKQYGEPPFHIAAYWLVPFSHNESEITRSIDRAAALHSQFNSAHSRSIRVLGIKLILDGTVDGCTAALLQPYGGLADLVEPIWPQSFLASAIRRATQSGLQCALHAIGDRTVQEAIDCLAEIPHARERRPRIEHLEVTTRADAKRLGDIGIIASVQPVHSDPATFEAWPQLIGDERCKRAFAYRDFVDNGAPLAFGTDAPTAKHLPLPNLYNATTRRSALEPTMQATVNPEFALPLATSVCAATSGAAFASFCEGWTGQLQPGMQADMVILDMQMEP